MQSHLSAGPLSPGIRVTPLIGTGERKWIEFMAPQRENLCPAFRQAGRVEKSSYVFFSIASSSK